MKRISRLAFVVCMIAFGLAPVARARPTQQGGAESTEPKRAMSLRGLVHMPDARAAAGAVVVCSAGGRAVSDERGEFHLRFDLPLAAQSVQLTAAHGSGASALGATAIVSVSGSGDDGFSGVLRLEAGGVCTPAWYPTVGSVAELNGTVHAFAVFDDGSGPTIYAAGAFVASAGTQLNHVAKWDGTRWSPLGAGLDDTVYALAAFDDGTGPALYAGGAFTTVIGGLPVSRIAKWDGASWSPVAGGVTGYSHTAVFALFPFDDGGGEALYVGGRFTFAGGMTARHLARWDGASWSSVAIGMDDEVRALAAFNDGSGAGRQLYAGGSFLFAGGVAASRIAKWNGSAWSPLGAGTDAQVRALAVYDDPSAGGPALYAGGAFTSAGGAAANRIARWNGASWSKLGSGLSGGSDTKANALAVYTSAGSTELYVIGSFLTAGGIAGNHIARWNGAVWAPVCEGSQNEGFALMVHDAGMGEGEELYAGGNVMDATVFEASNVSRWNGSRWSTMGSASVLGVGPMLTFDDGSGSALYAGALLNSGCEVAATHVVRWDGTAWSNLGGTVTHHSTDYPFVAALALFDAGSAGTQLYAAGLFTAIGATSANSIARWDGAAWAPLGSGTNRVVSALAVFDDGSGAGPALYAAGTFNTAGSGTVNSVAKWNGSAWSPLGTGLAGGIFLHPTAFALAVFDDGSGGGPELYVAGEFTSAGGVQALRIAKWDGSTWSPVGPGLNGTVHSLAVFDDGSGGGRALYAGGEFTAPAASAAIARWNGATWSGVGGGMSGGSPTTMVLGFGAHDDGSGSGVELYAGGFFSAAGGVAANHVAKWNGTRWAPLGGGLDRSAAGFASFDDGLGAGPALFVSGAFTSSPAGDSHFGKWVCDPLVPGIAYCFGDGSGSICPCANAGGAGEGCSNSTGMGAVISASGSDGVAADDLAFHGQHLLPNQSALLFVAENAVNFGEGLPFGDGLRCAGGGVRRLAIELPDTAGEASFGPGLGVSGGWAPGDTRFFQVWYRDPTGSPCGANFNLSHGWRVDFGP